MGVAAVFLALAVFGALVDGSLGQDVEEWLPTNDFCSPDNRGTQYTGSVSRSITGRPCIAWADAAKTYTYIRDKYFKEGSAKAAGNKCRNPTPRFFRHGTWCFVRDQKGDITTEYCGVMRCKTLQQHLRDCRDDEKCSDLKQCAETSSCGTLSINPSKERVAVTVGLDLSASTNTIDQQINFAKAFWEWATSDPGFRAGFLELSMVVFSTSVDVRRGQYFYGFFQRYPEASVAKEEEEGNFKNFIEAMEDTGTDGLTDLRAFPKHIIATDPFLQETLTGASVNGTKVMFMVSDFIQSVVGKRDLEPLLNDALDEKYNIVPVLMDKVYDPDSINPFYEAESAEIRMSYDGTSIENLKTAIVSAMESIIII